VIGLAVLAVGISLLECFVFNPFTPRFDEKYYRRQAESIAGGSYNDDYLVRPPLYSLFLGGIFRVFGFGLVPALIIQSILRGLVIVMAAWMGGNYVSRTGAIVGAAILVVYPGLIGTYSRLLTEVIYIPLFLLSFYLVEKTVRTEAVPDGIRAGIACGAASLARSLSASLTVLMAGWMLISASGSGRFSRKKSISAAVLVLVFLVTVSPWTIRNAVVHGGFMLVSNDTAFNLWLIASGEVIKDVTPEWKTWGTQAERQREAYRRWVSHMIEDPGLHVRRFVSGLPRLLLPEWGTRVPVKTSRQMDGPPVAGEIYRKLYGTLRPVTHLLLLVGGLAGVVFVERCSTRRNLLLLVFVYFIIVHGATLARVRYLVPLNVLMAAYSGALLARLLSLWPRRAA
jgi:4-amino-4-deoxy-L-arabinose transferase-like glycosyltransferase